MSGVSSQQILLEQIRVSCREVAEHSTRVRIIHDSIGPYAAGLTSSLLAIPPQASSCHFLGHGPDTVSFFLILNAVNFGSGFFPSILKDPSKSGYYTIASALNDRFACSGPLNAKQLAELTTRECHDLFGLNPSTPSARDLMGLFANALHELGSYLLSKFNGSFLRLVEAAEHSADRMVSLLAHLPSFRDEVAHGGQTVKFFKRAQLTVADLYLAFGGEEWGRFEDIDRLTIFADNLVPHVLRMDGILGYEPDLLAGIERREEIPSGSPEEIEIRACAVHACELVVDELKRLGQNVTALHLDQLLWHRGHSPEYRRHPRHITRTVFY